MTNLVTNLFTSTSGQGESLWVLHGWGMNHSVWSPVKKQLEAYYRVTWFDLPGHGQSNGVLFKGLDEVVELIAENLPVDPIHIMGWSLGGLIAQRIAERYPQKVKSLMLIATSPSFVARDQWIHAMPVDVLEGFVDSLEKDFELTIKRFLSLQFMGVKGVQADVKKLRADILANPPNMDALRAGLAVLKNTDLREASIACPKLWVLGALDKLVPVSVERDIAVHDLLDKTSIRIIDKAGHAPFISHPDEFVRTIRDFLNSLIAGNT